MSDKPKVLVVIEGGIVEFVGVVGHNEIEYAVLDHDCHKIGEPCDPLPLWAKELMADETIKEFEEKQERCGGDAWEDD